jgi:hypothetical protein
MSMMHDTIKVNLIQQGYLPNYPYHLISDEEMCDAFIKEDGTGYFYDYYPLVDDSLKLPYDNLVKAIMYYINECKQPQVDEYVFPDWVYSYMLGSVISVNSDGYDIQDLADMLNIEVDYGIFSSSLSSACYQISQEWLKKVTPDSRYLRTEDETLDLRPPTIFGEPHVIKYLRLLEVQVGEVRM